MNRKLVTLLTAFLLLLTALLPATVLGRAPAAQFTKGGIFIVQLAELPVVAYDGKINGLKATKAAKGAKVDPTSDAVVKYVAYLNGRHNGELKAAGNGKKLYDYTYSFNGFSAQLTAAEANKLAADPDVVAVTPNELVNADTSFTPDFLGLTAPGGLWAQLGGARQRRRGRHHRHHRLRHLARVAELHRPRGRQRRSERDRRTRSTSSFPVWQGKCIAGEQWFDATKLCNQKLIGARYYNAAWGGDAGMTAQRPWEFNSPRDYNGHGTHTSSTAGGNFGTPTTGPALQVRDLDQRHGAARAHRDVQGLWSTQDASLASGFSADIVAAIDQAVADGVDVINYSISGTRPTSSTRCRCRSCLPRTPASSSRPRPATAGPDRRTVAHPGPWLTTVAAGTHTRNGNGSVTLGNGTTYYGASLATALGSDPADRLDCSGPAGRQPDRSGTLLHPRRPLTFFGTLTPVLDPAKVAGKIVVCDRGANGRVNKSRAVKDAGGVGHDPGQHRRPSSLNADFHFVPTVHLRTRTRPRSRPTPRRLGATATINAVDNHLQRSSAVHGGLLFARSVDGGRRRPAQAGRHRPRPGHPGRRGAARQRRIRLQPVQRHVDVLAARGRPRGAAA